MDENKKCNKYEALFIFNGEEALNEHIKECSDCKNEHDKYYKVSFSERDISLNYDLFVLYSPTRRIFNRYKNNRKTYLFNYYKLINKEIAN